jgi:aldehyde dehydrogenase (NAD+)
MCFEHIFGALAGGNCVVLKPSEFTPETSALIEEVLHKNFPAGLIRVVNGGVDKSTELLAQNFDHIFFTGSTKVGKIVMQAAAKNLTPVVLELGGKSPCIIDETADLKTSAKRIIWGKFMNCGQTCVAPDYLLVPEKLAPMISNLLRQTLKDFYGQSFKDSPDYGKIVSKDHLIRLLEILKKGNFENPDYDLENRFLSPVIWENCDWDMSVMDEEIFGPILPIISYKDKNEVITKLKTLPAALALYYFGDDQSFQDQLIQQVPFGGGCFNDTVLHLGNSNIPFGGVKESGMGRYHGKRTFEAFTYEKGIMTKGTLIDPPLRYPPVAKNIGLIKKILG